MGKVITFTIQKGGTGKSTTSGITAHLMAKEGYKVLVIDMDSQGNVSDLLTQLEPEAFLNKTILDAIKYNEPEEYIIKVSDYLHVIPADDYLATFPRFLYTKYTGNITLALRELIEPIRDDYDFILIDTPPSLGEPTTNAICASDYVVMLAESSKWAFTAIPRLIETVIHARNNIGINVNILGLLRTMTDARRSDSKALVELMGEEYEDFVFNTVIKRKAATGRLPIETLDSEANKEYKEAVSLHKEFYDELKERIGVTTNV